jgi:NAD(P)-dependent dehydrogenase (short-subunit alcohol dehydrogenase family)
MLESDRRVAIVTGCNTGIGLHTVAKLVEKEHHVVMACRSPPKALEAMQTIVKLLGHSPVPQQFSAEPVLVCRGSLQFIPLDLTNVASIVEFVETFKRTNNRLDVSPHCFSFTLC